MEDEEPAENDPSWSEGVITQFLRRNLFKVRLTDGQEVVATMPSELLRLVANVRFGLKTHFISVKVEIRKLPRTHRIIAARENGLVGSACD